MIDIHCHLLPQVDDGPDSLAEALEMCRQAVAEGTTHAVCTPHVHPGRWENNAHSIAVAVKELRGQLQAGGIDLQLGFAGEVRLSDQLPLQVKRGEIPFYGQVDGYQVMLLEFPHGHIPPGSDKLTAWLLAQRIRPLIAHPERNRQVMKGVECIYPFVEMGCWLQLTAGALYGGFGERAGEIARHLLGNDMVAVVASDGHNPGARRPVLATAFDCLAREYGESVARRLLVENPARLAAEQFPGAGELAAALPN